jgi:acyl-CoA synthetase (AMP-forming)/AMP-acid ligase II
VTLSVSPPLRIAAICGLVFTVIVFGGLRLLGSHGGGGSTATPHVIRHHPFGAGAAKTPTKTAAPTKAHATPSKANAKPQHVVATPKPQPVVDITVVKAARAAGLPESLAQALGRSKTVVVSLYDPYSQVDGPSFAEAKAGATLAGVAFVPLNVLSQRDVGKLTQQLGLLPDPGVLVYVRPASLAAKIAGFADKETVAQAARNASLGQ